MIETKTEDYKSHKYSYNVYVEINTKTKLGQNLLEQYRRQAKKQYIDIGRIGYHDEYGRYILDHYTLFELLAVPKLIISVHKTAIDKAGRDEYKLRTYMSKFGQLNFMLLVDKNSAELYLIEDVFIENLNHKENYETLIYKLRYSTKEQVPLREIFFKFGIKSNPDDYGKAFKTEAPINNIIVAKAKAEMTINLANQIASSINQKALVTSLNFLNKEGTYGKSVTKEYSKKVSKSKELNELSSSPKLENTLNNVLIKTLEQQTTRSDVKDKTNFIIYKKVLEVELTSHSEVKKEVNKANNKQNLKEFLLGTYGKHQTQQENEEEINKNKFETFEKIIEHKYDFKSNKETSKPIEEDFKAKEIVINSKEEFYDFNNKKLEINFNMDRFKTPEDENKKLQNKQQAKILKKQEKKKAKLAKKINKNIKVLNAECNLDEEFERSKQVLGILPSDSKKKKKKAIKSFFSEDNKKHKILKEQKTDDNRQPIEETNKLSIIEKIEKQIRLQKVIKNKNFETNKNLKRKQNLKNKKTVKNSNKLIGNNQNLNENKTKKSRKNFSFKTIGSKVTNKINKKKNQTDLLLPDTNNKQNKKQVNINFIQKTNQSELNPAKIQQSSKEEKITSQPVRTNNKLKQEKPLQEFSNFNKHKTSVNKEYIIKQHFAKNNQSEVQNQTERDKKFTKDSEHKTFDKLEKSTNLLQTVDTSTLQAYPKKNKKQEDFGQGM